MTAIWRNDGSGWHVLAPSGFPNEATLHSLVEDAPQMLPLAGNASLTIVGREVILGSGKADLIAVEPSGRIAVIEIKLARNAEARRAVIAQVLTYAAYLREMSVATLEEQVLAHHLIQRGFGSLSAAVAAQDQVGAFDPDQFSISLAENLRQGAFRLVIVLDEAPDELVQLVGYLESVAHLLTIDLITVAAYEIAGSQVLVPQRIEPERHDESRSTAAATPTSPAPQGQLTSGSSVFQDAIPASRPAFHTHLRRLADWADQLERDGLATVYTFRSAAGRMTLLPRIQPDNAGFVTIWLDWGGNMSLWRSLFERRAPQTLKVLEELITPAYVGQGTKIEPDTITDTVLDTLTAAYREAAHGQA